MLKGSASLARTLIVEAKRGPCRLDCTCLMEGEGLMAQHCSRLSLATVERLLHCMSESRRYPALSLHSPTPGLRAHGGTHIDLALRQSIFVLFLDMRSP